MKNSSNSCLLFGFKNLRWYSRERAHQFFRCIHAPPNPRDKFRSENTPHYGSKLQSEWCRCCLHAITVQPSEQLAATSRWSWSMVAASLPSSRWTSNPSHYLSEVLSIRTLSDVAATPCCALFESTCTWVERSDKISDRTICFNTDIESDRNRYKMN